MQKVAIIIPTLDRIKFLVRLINYYSNTKSNITIYFGDSSKKNYAKLISKLSQKKNIVVNYFHIPGMNDREAIAFLSTKVKEKYVAFSGDDDYFVPESLNLCSNFLNENLDYRTAQGRAYLYNYIFVNNELKINYFESYWETNQILSHDVEKRLLDYSKNYYVTEFSVHRTNEFIEDVRQAAKISNRHIGEYYRCFNFIGKGKSKFIDCLYLMRTSHAKRGESNLSKTYYSHEDFIKSNSFEESLSQFKTNLNFLLSNNKKNTEIINKKILKEIIDNIIYSKRKKSRTFTNILISKIKKVFSILSKPLLMSLIILNKINKSNQISNKIILKKNAFLTDYNSINNFFTFFNKSNIINKN